MSKNAAAARRHHRGYHPAKNIEHASKTQAVIVSIIMEQQPNQSTKSHPRRRPWTPSELEFVRQNHGKLSNIEIATRINRSVNSIQGAVARLSLSTRADRGPSLTEFIVEKHAQGWNDYQMAREWKCDITTIRKRREHIGLTQNRDTRSGHRKALERNGVDSLASLQSKRHKEAIAAKGWPNDLLRPQEKILAALWEHGPMTQPEVREKAGIRSRRMVTTLRSRGSVSYFEDLVQRGIIVRMSAGAKNLETRRAMPIYMINPFYNRRSPQGEP